MTSPTLEKSPESRRPLILHITGDYPDPVREPTTVAIKRLIDRLDQFEHVIFSLKRIADPRKSYFRECPAPAPNQRLIAYGHFGLPFGVGLATAFSAVARRIEAHLAANALRPDVVHSHRLTFDGIAGHAIARRRAIPHLVSVRGEVESKILRFKPTYRPLVRRIAEEAERVLYVSAWFEPELARIARIAPGRSRPFPNIVANARPVIATRPPRPAFVTAANLDIFRKKGIDRLIAAFAQAAPHLPGVGLDIYGGGRPASVEEVRRLIAASGLEGRVVLKGQVANSAFLAALPEYLALALPGRNETFGMVYTEALFAGVPILYGRDTGIDGYLDGLDCGVGAGTDDVAAIAAGLRDLHDRNAALRAAIAAAAGELFRRFDPDRLIALYQSDIATLVRRDVA